MNKYIGTKLIKAQAMTHLAYNELRGWEVPEDENGDDEGYLVEYLDGGQSNHADYTGYISWAPKEVFNKAYRLIEGSAAADDGFILNLAAEYTLLKEKVVNLGVFIESGKFNKLSPEEKSLLRLQYGQMQPYLSTLKARLNFYSVYEAETKEEPTEG